MKRSIKVAAVSGLAAAITGITLAATAGGDPTTPTQPPAVEQGVNDRGETFGDGGKARSDAELPDLIAAIATNGKYGYIRKSDYLGPQLSLEQVQSLPQVSIDGTQILTSGPRTFPVYESDGVTVVGEFTAQ